MAMTGFRGTVGGSVQSNYTDQPGQGIAGMLAFASEQATANLDSMLIAETNGVYAGQGIVAAVNNANGANSFDLQAPNKLVSIPAANNLTIADFAGIVVFDETMQSDSNGKPGLAKGRVARILRPGKSGGRIYVPVNSNDTVVPGTSTVNWVIAAGSDAKYAPGQFTTAALAGDATHGYSVAITTASWVTSGAAGTLAIIELG